MAAQPGFVRARLHQALDDEVKLRFINVAQWASGTAYDQARTNPKFFAEVRRLRDDPNLHITGQPAPYWIAIEVSADQSDHAHNNGRGQTGPSTKTGKTDGPVILINPFTIPPAETELFPAPRDAVNRTTAPVGNPPKSTMC